MDLHHATRTMGRLTGALFVAAALLAGVGVHRAEAATPSVPRLTAVEANQSHRSLLIRWAPASNDARGYRVNIYQNDVLFSWYNLGPAHLPDGAHDIPEQLPEQLKSNTRYCVGLKAWIGTGNNGSSTFSQESGRLCATTLAYPDLTVMRITGRAQLFVGESSVYEVVVANRGDATTNGTSLTLTSTLARPDTSAPSTGGVELVGHAANSWSIRCA